MTEEAQVENGYTAIANRYLEELCCFRIPGELRQVLDAIFRKTYGYHKKEDWVSISQIVELTKMKKSNVSRSLSKLITHRLVIRSDNKLSPNKHFKEWLPFGVIKSDNSKKVISSDQKVIRSDNKKLSEVMDTKEIKETIQKKGTNVPDKRNPEIDEVLIYGKIVLKTWADDRRAVQNLLKLNQRLELKPDLNRVEWVKALIDLVSTSRQDQYAPRIGSYAQLLKRRGELFEWLGRTRATAKKKGDYDE